MTTLTKLENKLQVFKLFLKKPIFLNRIGLSPDLFSFSFSFKQAPLWEVCFMKELLHRKTIMIKKLQPR